MDKSRERSEASYSTSRAEELAESYRKKETAKIWHGLKTGSVAGETICAHYLAGMKAIIAEAEKMCATPADSAAFHPGQKVTQGKIKTAQNLLDYLITLC
jgi:hypothetical protein